MSSSFVNISFFEQKKWDGKFIRLSAKEFNNKHNYHYNPLEIQLSTHSGWPPFVERHLIAVTEIPGRLRAGISGLLKSLTKLIEVFIIILSVATNWKAPFIFLIGRAINPDKRCGGAPWESKKGRRREWWRWWWAHWCLQCGDDQTNGGGSVWSWSDGMSEGAQKVTSSPPVDEFSSCESNVSMPEPLPGRSLGARREGMFNSLKGWVTKIIEIAELFYHTQWWWCLSPDAGEEYQYLLNLIKIPPFCCSWQLSWRRIVV